jgi:hypothetical protein
MVKLPRITGLVVLSSLGLTTGWVIACHAATSATLDILPNDITAPPDRVEVGQDRMPRGHLRVETRYGLFRSRC